MTRSLRSLLSAALIIHRCQGFSATPTGRRRAATTTILASSNDAAFSAFADSLQEEPETVEEQPWQAKLEDLIDPQTNLADRQILMSELLNANDEIRDSVLDAVSSRKIDPLLTPTGKRMQAGTRAVVRQLANDILPQLSRTPPPFPPTPKDFEKVGSRIFEVVTNQVQKNIEDLQEDLTDPINKIPERLSKQAEGFVTEARNVFLEKPEGLDGPSFVVVESSDLYDIREYDGYKVASTRMVEKGEEDLASTGTAFNALASYLFGQNDESREMEMTTPVTTTSSSEMRFYLSGSSIPSPLADSGVEIVEIPRSMLAVREFAGFVTEGEIARQKDALLQALESDGVELDVAHGAVVPHFVFQYNPPYALPIVRRNEIAVPVRSIMGGEGVEPLGAARSLKEEWSVDDDGFAGEVGGSAEVEGAAGTIEDGKEEDGDDAPNGEDTSPSD